VLAPICIILAAITIMTAGSAAAQVSRGDGVLTFNGGYITGSSAITGNTVDGGLINLTSNWLWDNELIEDNVLHAFNLGVGFRLGS
jgi:hypothetical protein